MEQAKLIENAGKLNKLGRRPGEAAPRWTVTLALALVRVALVVAVWAAVVALGHYPAVLLPSPQIVLQEFALAIGSGQLAFHMSSTLLEVVLGLALGVTAASVLGYLLAHFTPAERFLAPYLVASQATPAVAVAPLLYIWFGAGLLTKVLVCALVVFFPVLINVIVGVRSVEGDLVDLMRSLRATRWQMFAKLELPAALPVVLGGLKIGATLAVIGAIVGEMQGGQARGLWAYTYSGLLNYQTPQVFVGILSMVFLALVLYGGIAYVERRVLAWKN